MAIIKMNDQYDNIYLSDKNISLGAKGLLTFLLMTKEDFDQDSNVLCNYSNDSNSNIKKYIDELTENNYLTVVKKIQKQNITYNYVVYHNRWKMI